MFGIGPTEIVLVLVIALIVFGPKRLPELEEGDDEDEDDLGGSDAEQALTTSQGLRWFGSAL